MLDTFFDQIVSYLSLLGYWGIGIAMAIESACIPLPSEIIMPFGGYLVSKGVLNLYGVTLAGAVGNLAGSILAYYVGLRGGRPFLHKYGRYFFLQKKHLNLADKWFIKYGEAAVFFGRLLPGIRTFISLPAGIAAMNFKKFFVYSFLGALPWSFALTFAGFALGQNWGMIRGVFKRLDFSIVIILLIIILVLILKGKKQHVVYTTGKRRREGDGD